jgi:hypothetical protein
MPNVLYKVLYTLGAVAIVALILVLGIRQYGNARVAAQELGSVKEAVQEAVAARESAVKVDVYQSAENAAKGREIRAVLAPVRKKNNEIPKSDCDAVGDAERIRLLNLAIAEANRVIATSGKLPE